MTNLTIPTKKLRIPRTTLSYLGPTMDHSLMLDHFTFDDIYYLVKTNPYLGGYMQGYLAELVLQRDLEGIPEVSRVKKIPDSDKKKGDFEILYKGVEITVECKSIRGGSVKPDPMHDSWTGSVQIKNSNKREITVNGENVVMTNLCKGTFDVLAISCYAVNGTWSFLFIENQYLFEHPALPGVIPTSIPISPVTTSCVQSNLEATLEKVYLNKINNLC